MRRSLIAADVTIEGKIEAQAVRIAGRFKATSTSRAT
jgi:hypothetical protein